MQSYQDFYASIQLPSWAPPEAAFGIAWSIIYPLFIIATVLVVVRASKGRVPWSMVWLLAANWVFNLLFTPVQLGLDALWPASLVILAVLGTLAAFQWLAWKRYRLAFWLMLPYLVWGLYATALQLTITFTN